MVERETCAGMKMLNLERPVEMLLALLRAALYQREVETVYFRHSTAEDWVRCYRLAVQQGVPALAWGAVERLPVECSPPLDVKLSWALLEEEQLEKYRIHCRAVNELTRLYAQHGIATVVLKGVGLSRLYPVPAHREGGDVDIYTFSADRNCMTDEEANRLANELMGQQGVDVDYSYAEVHSSFFYRGVRFENHREFLNKDIFSEIAELDGWLNGALLPQTVSLPDGEGDICVPSLAFDWVFVALHAAKHYGVGLSLRHLCDWAVLLRQEDGGAVDKLENKCLLRVTGALSLLCNRYLGASISVDGDDRLSNEMMKEIIYPRFSCSQPLGNPVGACWQKIRFKLHLLWLRHRLLGVSIGKGVMGLFVSVLRKPSRLYR